MLNTFIKLKKKAKLMLAKRAGLQIADDCRLIECPSFLSEPYLVTIGHRVCISSNVTFITHDGGTWAFRHQPKYKDIIRFARITIKDNCFIGCGVTIMPGVTIGENSVIGARSVVTKDVPPNSVFAGNPARFIKSVQDYAEKCLAENPDYDIENYKRNKKQEILKTYPAKQL